MISSWVFWALLLSSAYAYWKLPQQRDWVLVIAGGVFVCANDWRSAAAIAGLCGVSFVVARRGGALPKWVTGLVVLAALGFLAWYKYYPPIHDAIDGITHARKLDKMGQPIPDTGVVAVVPLGASYFTFKLVHYLVDGRRGVLPKHDFKQFLSYMLFIPMFTAGPIEQIEPYLKNRAPALTSEHIAEAGTRILYGLVKKMVIVDILLTRHVAEIPHELHLAIPFYYPPCSADVLVKHVDTVNPLFVWQFTIHRFVQWYLDFSAYSDIAVGTALIFGIRLVENFDWPIFATNPTAFWKRYHVSLSAWCQRYVYLPVLGRTRNPYLAVYATMLAIGFWHAGNLNYLAWGLYQGTVIVVYLTWGRIKRWRKWKPKGNGIAIAGTFATLLAVAPAMIFPATSSYGVRAALKLLAALVRIRA